jgi:hypothetical protein
MITPTTSAWAAIASTLLAAVSNMRMEGLRCRRNIRQARYDDRCGVEQYCCVHVHVRFTQL